MRRCWWFGTPRILGSTAALGAVLAIAVTSAAAQTSTGVLSGAVRDAIGAVLPGAMVSLTHVDTNARIQTQSDDRGRYRFAQLSPGSYRLEAALPGFKRFVLREIPLAVQEQARLDVTLDVGPVIETVEVTASATRLDALTSSVDHVVDNARIQALPLDTRNIYTLVNLTPGVAGEIGQTHNRVSYSVNGARAGLMDTLIDGASAAFPTVNGGHGISVFPSVDAVQEFRLFGKSSG